MNQEEVEPTCVDKTFVGAEVDRLVAYGNRVVAYRKKGRH
jgi:hypothetical protein